MRKGRDCKFAVLVTALAAGAPALGHDDAAAPHLRCTPDGSDTLICLYDRHPTGPTRTSRVGYADKGRYLFSCPEESSNNRTFRTEICPAGTGTATAFQCWTQERLDAWVDEDEANDAASREDVRQVYVFESGGIQETLLKLLADPAKVGRPNFIAGGANGTSAADIRDYAGTCEISTEGALGAQDVANLLPTLKVFGRVD